MNTLIISDVHLNVAEDGRERMAEFVRFLRGIDSDRTDQIVILGDLFDFWFEYRHVIFSGYFEVLCAFAGLRDRGVRFHFVCGNHDFWAGMFLREHLRFEIHPATLTLELGGKRVRFVHGDGINPSDAGYRVYKRIARSRVVVWLFGLLHPDWAMGLAQKIARTSRKYKTPKDPATGSEVKPLREYARRVLEAGEADVVVCGHSHYPVREEFTTPRGTGIYINAGDWLLHRSYVEWDGREFALRSARREEAGREAAGQPVASRYA
jgi:UDP-2,3-diacylglucosamine hydrolase